MAVWRLWTPTEVDLLAYAWGASTIWHHLPTGCFTDGPARVEFDTEDPVWSRKLHIPPDAMDSTKVHEAGHAIHLHMFPESANWPTEKCEAFAMLGVVKAGLRGDYGDLPEVLEAERIAKLHPVFYHLRMKEFGV